MLERLGKVTKLEAALAEANKRAAKAEATLKDMESQNRKLMSKKLTAEALVREHEADQKQLEARFKTREDNLAERERLISEGRKVIDEGRVELTRLGETLRLEARNDFLELWKTHKISYQRQGATHSRLNFLISPVGQEFLRIMHQELLATFVRTEEFCKASLKGFGTLVAEAIRVVCMQMDASSEQMAKIKRNEFKTQMNLGLISTAMGIDTSLPDEWWIPVMEKAARILIEKDNFDPSLPRGRLYNLPYLANLTAEQHETFVLQRTDSLGSDLSEGILEAIDRVCGPEVTHDGALSEAFPVPPSTGSMTAENAPYRV